MFRNLIGAVVVCEALFGLIGDVAAQAPRPADPADFLSYATKSGCEHQLGDYFQPLIGISVCCIRRENYRMCVWCDQQAGTCTIYDNMPRGIGRNPFISTPQNIAPVEPDQQDPDPIGRSKTEQRVR
jgi:hypothetical protein